MKVEASPISATESASPKIRISGCSCAAPATASTLSSDIDTSAMMIWITASRSVLRPCTAGNRAVGVEIGAGNGLFALVHFVRLAEFAVHLPAHPEQQDAARDQEARRRATEAGW